MLWPFFGDSSEVVSHRRKIEGPCVVAEISVAGKRVDFTTSGPTALVEIYAQEGLAFHKVDVNGVSPGGFTNGLVAEEISVESGRSFAVWGGRDLFYTAKMNSPIVFTKESSISAPECTVGNAAITYNNIDNVIILLGCGKGERRFENVFEYRNGFWQSFTATGAIPSASLPAKISAASGSDKAFYDKGELYLYSAREREWARFSIPYNQTCNKIAFDKNSDTFYCANESENKIWAYNLARQESVEFIPGCSSNGKDCRWNYNTFSLNNNGKGFLMLGLDSKGGQLINYYDVGNMELMDKALISESGGGVIQGVVLLLLGITLIMFL